MAPCCSDDIILICKAVKSEAEAVLALTDSLAASRDTAMQAIYSEARDAALERLQTLALALTAVMYGEETGRANLDEIVRGPETGKIIDNLPDDGGAAPVPAAQGFNAAAERKKIQTGVYDTHVKKSVQRKHQQGTQEFAQNRAKMQRKDQNSEPGILNDTEDAQALVDKYKGTGDVRKRRGSAYPQEVAVADRVIGKAWDKRNGVYVDTDTFVIIYSGKGAHILPIRKSP
jgi:membrane-anchored protein YejM (alkaline phosphatase superfamily)